MKTFLCAVCMTLTMCAVAYCGGSAKTIIVRPMVNPEPPFQIRLSVDKPDRVYYQGERMTINVVSESDGYLYLLYIHNDQAVCVYPNEFQPTNSIKAKEPVQVPGKDAKFALECDAPYGPGVLVAVVSRQQLNIEPGKAGLPIQGLVDMNVTELKRFVLRVTGQQNNDWAEARLEILTSDKKVARTAKRYAVCIGIGPYKSKGIEPLQSSQLDARRFAEAIRSQCKADDVVLLTNEQATRAAIEKAIFADLPRKAKPGDTVFIFYSGHGWRVADTNRDEQDGYDEVLVPYDAEFGKPETMILDDTFARWLQELDGCQIGVILDNCYSGGSSKGIKGLGQQGPNVAGCDFFDGELRRAKDLGMSGTMVLAACEAGQLAWEMPEAGKGSVLTHYILDVISPDSKEPTAANDESVRPADANHDGQLTFGEVYQAVRDRVQSYVHTTFQERQSPVLLNNANDGIVLRPQ